MVPSGQNLRVDHRQPFRLSDYYDPAPFWLFKKACTSARDTDTEELHEESWTACVVRYVVALPFYPGNKGKIASQESGV